MRVLDDFESDGLRSQLMKTVQKGQWGGARGYGRGLATSCHKSLPSGLQCRERVTDPSKWPCLTGGLLLTPVHCGALLTTHLRPTPKPIPPSTAVTPQASSGGVTILHVCSTGLKHFHAFLVALFIHRQGTDFQHVGWAVLPCYVNTTLMQSTPEIE